MGIYNYMGCVFIEEPDRSWRDISMERVVILSGGINSDYT